MTYQIQIEEGINKVGIGFLEKTDKFELLEVSILPVRGKGNEEV